MTLIRVPGHGYLPLETTTRPAGAHVFEGESPAARLVQHRALAATGEAPLPQPQAVKASVWVDAVSRTLTARLPDQAGGYERMLWIQAWQQLRRAQENGWPEDGASPVWADLPGARRVVHGGAGEGGTLLFVCPPKTPGFAALVSRPDVIAITVIDRGSQRFMSCRFLHGPR